MKPQQEEELDDDAEISEDSEVSESDEDEDTVSEFHSCASAYLVCGRLSVHHIWLFPVSSFCLLLFHFLIVYCSLSLYFPPFFLFLSP